MTALKEELIECIQDIPDERLITLKPLIKMLAYDMLYVEKILADDLTANELESIKAGFEEYQKGECLDFEDYLSSRK